MNPEIQPWHPGDGVGQKPATIDAAPALYSFADPRQSFAAMEAPALVAAEKTLDQLFGSFQLFDSAAPQTDSKAQGYSPTKVEPGSAKSPDHKDSGNEMMPPESTPEPTSIKSIRDRLNDAPFPRIAQMWHPADRQPGETADQTEAEHDLVLSSVESLGLQWQKSSQGESTVLTKDSIQAAVLERENLLKLNPNMVTIAEIRYHDAKGDTFPSNSQFWQDGPDGKPIANDQYSQYQMTNWSDQKFQKFVVDQAVSVIKSGAADGVMLDWWHDGHDTPADKQEKMNLLVKVRDAVGPNALIMINTNEETLPEIMPAETQKMGEKAANQLVNGYYMESAGSVHDDPKQEKEEYRKIAQTLAYSVDHTAQPQITVVETWHPREQQRDDPQVENDQERQMRATTTLAMTLSNGFSLYGDPDGMKDTHGKAIPDHGHEMYPFYSAAAQLGKPLSPEPTSLPSGFGSVRREFANGTVICNATGDGPAEVKFNDDRVRFSTGEVIKAGTEVDVAPQDGDIFIKT